ncbi:hypothetical protein [Fuscibacter oryzae]|uniref:Uncharacterized protein n=1 Tax=Fuscibacter oryzae TaxID=2803939 RepID=A0A8J7SVC2_9RHOB|nr:hypothetical protein [Fuscibacter oryzae]MBL4929372.1 hypothetical protein [Fuscibacter oryzae]
MRTFAAHQRDQDQGRYDDEDQLGMQHDPTTRDGAMAILSSRGGKKAAQIAILTLWRAAKDWRDGYMPTARIGAPLRVIQALENIGLVEVAEDDRGMALRFRLTPKGALMAAKRQGAGK